MATPDEEKAADVSFGDQIQVAGELPEHLKHYAGKKGILKSTSEDQKWANVVFQGAKGGGATCIPFDCCKVTRKRLVLPTTVYPTHYFVSLEPNMVDWVPKLFPGDDDKADEKTLLFNGRATIDLYVQAATNQIVFNSVDIKYDSAIITQGSKTFDIAGGDITLSKKPEAGHNPETATIQLPEQLTVSTGDRASGSADNLVKLVLKFQGELNDKMKGFYRSKYTSDGQEKYAATTQFEATDARRAFPCWDEPGIKSEFTIQLTVPNHLVAISNMPEASNEDLEDTKQKRVTFQRTPIMSTYLVAFVIGEFEHIEGKTKNGTAFRVFTPVGKTEKGRFALETGIRCLEWFEDYYKVKFPLPKEDMIAIPDFAAGAMENWGLVTYRETAILADAKSSVSQRQWVAIVICHELAHQWFGNLVTMQWWDNLWLNEGFACFMEYISSNALFEDWGMWSLMVANEFSRAMELDSMESSHPIEVDIFAPPEVDEVFDAISYSKGACVIRMIEKYIGADVFQNAIAKYLAHFQYKNTVTADLWSFLGKESGQPIADIMGNWTREKGYPVLNVSRVAANSDKLALKQTRFLASGPPTAEQDRVIWSIPVVGLTDSGKVIKTLLQTKEGTMRGDKDAAWIKLNPGCSGFYIVNYSDELLAAFSAPIASKTLSEIDRLSIIQDATMLCKAGIRQTPDVLNLFKAYTGETEFAVWAAILKTAGDIGFLVRYNEHAGKFDTVMQGLLRPIGDSLGWEKQDGDTDDRHKLRTAIISARIRFKDPDVIAEAKRRFGLGFDCKEITKDLVVPIYKCVLDAGGRAEYEKLFQRYKDIDDKEEMDRILRVIGFTGDPECIADLLKLSLTEEIRSQDTVFLLRGAAANKKGGQMCWEFLVENWDALFKAFGGGMLVSYLAKTPGLSFTTSEKADEVKAFFETKKASCPSGARAMDQAEETIRVNASWLGRDRLAIEKWLIDA